MRKLAILTSGGDTPGMNAAIYSAVKTARAKDITIIGVEKGYKGLIEGRLRELSGDDVNGIECRGGTFLKTARCPEMLTPEGQEKAVRVLKAYEVEGLIVIGGDGSMKGAWDLSKRGVAVIGLPGTIDNDLNYTDFTIGFDTAVNNVINEIAKIRDTMESHERVGIVEVMGNNDGDIAMFSGVASGSEYIIVPEREWNIDELCMSLQSRKIKGQNTSIVVVSEGAGKGKEIAGYIKEHTDIDAKAIVLGYTQRGGSPSAFDRILAQNMGATAVRLLDGGKINRVIGIRDFKITDYSFDEAMQMEKRFDGAMYDLHSVLHAN